jgi:hypothetical protein
MSASNISIFQPLEPLDISPDMWEEVRGMLHEHSSLISAFEDGKRKTPGAKNVDDL